MSVPYIPKITTGGQDAAITARENGFAFEVTHMSFGTGSYVMTGNETALANEVARVPIAGGGKIAGMLSLVINTILRDADLNVGVGQPVNIKEIGFWNEGVLFAIYSVNTVLFTKHLGLDFAMTYSLALKTLMPIDAANITVVIDESASITLALIGQHLAGSNPHPQYATVIMLNAEVAARIAADSYTAERLQANGIDADLGTTNALTLNNLDGLITVGEYYVHLLDNIPFSYVLAKVWRENENIVYQFIQGAGNTRLASRYGSRNVNTDTIAWQDWKYYASVAELEAHIFRGLLHGIDANLSAAPNDLDGANLNSAINSGEYGFEGTEPNRPFDYGFLKVWRAGGDFVCQLAQGYSGYPAKIAYRFSGNNGVNWSDWEIPVTESQVATIVGRYGWPHANNGLSISGGTTYSFTLKAGQAMRVLLIGGGGGGASHEQSGYTNNATDGEDSYLNIDGTRVMTAKGGLRGTPSFSYHNDNNDYNNGVDGASGVVEVNRSRANRFTVIRHKNGAPSGVSANTDSPFSYDGFDNYGKGATTIGFVTNVGYAGAGGGGALVEFFYVNPMSYDVTALLYAGNRGLSDTASNDGQAVANDNSTSGLAYWQVA